MRSTGLNWQWISTGDKQIMLDHGLPSTCLDGPWISACMIVDTGTMKPTPGTPMKALEDPDLTEQQHQLLTAIQGVRHIVISKCHGGFGLSTAAIRHYHKIKGIRCWVEKGTFGWDRVWLVPKNQRVDHDIAPEQWHAMTLAERQHHNALCDQQMFCDRDIARDDPVLVQVVRELGTKRASNRFADLKIVEIPADVQWQIEEYDGAEWVAEVHRVWS
jgi:hypothetical protein